MKPVHLVLPPLQKICLLAPGDIRGMHTVVLVRTAARLFVPQYEPDKRRTRSLGRPVYVERDATLHGGRVLVRYGTNILSYGTIITTT